MAYTDFETFSELTPAECAAAFQTHVENATYGLYAIFVHAFSGFVQIIPIVGILIKLVVLPYILTAERSYSFFHLSLSSMDNYFQCAIGEEGFTQELYETDFFMRKNFIKQTMGEMNQWNNIPIFGYYTWITGMLAISDVLTAI